MGHLSYWMFCFFPDIVHDDLRLQESILHHRIEGKRDPDVIPKSFRRFWCSAIGQMRLVLPTEWSGTPRCYLLLDGGSSHHDGHRHFRFSTSHGWEVVSLGFCLGFLSTILQLFFCWVMSDVDFYRPESSLELGYQLKTFYHVFPEARRLQSSIICKRMMALLLFDTLCLQIKSFLVIFCFFVPSCTDVRVHHTLEWEFWETRSSIALDFRSKVAQI